MEDLAASGDDEVAVMLKKLSVLWRSRAAVNQELPDYQRLAFDPSRQDFSCSLLPFRHHQAWTEAPAALRSRCLSYGWAIYNLKTIYIECDVVTPACEDIIKTPPPGANGALLQDVMSEALLDEALHTRMSIKACNYIYDMRGIAPLDFADFNLVRWRAQLLAGCNAQWQRRLTRFAIACASETLITDYLKTMAEDGAIQAICHEVTKTHAADEWSHSSVFSGAAATLVGDMSQSERAYFRSIILKTVGMFADPEMGAWSTVFSMLKFPHAREIIEDIGVGDTVAIYTASVENLIERIGLRGPEIDLNSMSDTASARQVGL
ncbi:AurF N-oxygenase family protein [Herbaspirillum sp. alder98]|uniref:AurF N-oxygenase family protein n=1 Tax=Herbaspirillum sp. alder98 TaxID=2913096 RepID=UPI001CD8B860|nr:diiron oxygenase [Herbaspirillum sp. alder98]MCA1324430.1 diiron oxygenase [Herbaspirillum sp. alder98]